MLRAYVKAPAHLSRGILRVEAALERFAGENGIAIVDTPEAADLEVLHCIGVAGVAERIAAARAGGRRVALVQYCYLTTEAPGAWPDLWRDCAVVWTYYDLTNLFRTALGVAQARDRLYLAPLGVDGDVFRPSTPARKPYLVGTSGYVAETEGVRECHAAAAKLGRQHFHLGPMLELGEGHCFAIVGVDDAAVAAFWSQCSYVAGLRRVEGFELPALEALACGSRPIVFEAPHYRSWFGEHAEYVPEAGFDEVVDALLRIMGGPYRPVRDAERRAVLERFDWRGLVRGFYERVVR